MATTGQRSNSMMGRSMSPKEAEEKARDFTHDIVEYATDYARQNPGTAAIQASVDGTSATGPVPITGLTNLVVRAGARVAIHLTGSELAAALRGPLVVTGSGPLVVERDLYGSSSPGIALALGAPDINAK